MNVRCMDAWMDGEKKSRQKSWEYYSVGQRAELRTIMNAECKGGLMNVWNNGNVQERKLVPADMKKAEGRMREGSQRVGVRVRNSRCMERWVKGWMDG